MRSLPVISLVTCSFQQGRYLDATLRSVLDQHYPALQYVVMDGGSTDSSVEVIRRHESRLHGWVSAPDGGQTDALIQGFARTDGSIMGWLCSDDLLLPGALQTVAGYFDAHPEVDAAYGDVLWIDARGRFIRAKKEAPFRRFSFLFDHNHVPQPAMFWRRSLYDAVGGLDAAFDLAMDSDLWERFSRVTRIGKIPAYLACMRDYPEQKTRALRPKGALEDARIRQRALPRGGDWLAAWLRPAARLQRIAAKALAGGYRARVDPAIVRSLDDYRIPS